MKVLPSPPDRAEEIYDLGAKVFGGYFGFLRFCRDVYFPGSTYDWDASRVIEADGRIVSHVGVWKYRMRVGRARLISGGIGAVMTHGDYRNRRYASKLMWAILDAMRAGGYHFSVLGGRPNYYHRFGYVQAWGRTKHVVEIADLPAEKLALAVRKVPLTEAVCGRGAVMRLYNRENATRTGTAERPIYTAVGGLWLDGECRTLSDGDGTVRGYLVTSKSGDELRVAEVGGLKAPCGVGQLTAAIRRIARRAGCHRISLEDMPYDHPLCVAMRLSNCRVEMRHTRSGGYMGVVVSLAGALEAMAGELSDRLARSAFRTLKGTLKIAGAGERVSLLLGAGKVRIGGAAGQTANRIDAGDHVARLLIGSEDPAALAGQGCVKFAGAASELAEVLFPRQWPMLSSLDHF